MTLKKIATDQLLFLPYFLAEKFQNGIAKAAERKYSNRKNPVCDFACKTSSTKNKNVEAGRLTAIEFKKNIESNIKKLLFLNILEMSQKNSDIEPI